MHDQLNKFAMYTDEELMHFIINGEEFAFNELYKRYAKKLLGYFTRMLNYDKEMAEDALQDVFLKIAEDPTRFDRSRSFKTWVFTVASNQCKNFYRHQTIVNQKKQEIVYLNSSINENDLTRIISKLDGVQFQNVLQEILNELPVEKKEAFILKYQEEKTNEEIAEIQECSIGTVKSRVHYTLRTLEEKLIQFNPNN
jgi:RNA polymerase sigma-70 factor (ECF subfamily)